MRSISAAAILAALIPAAALAAALAPSAVVANASTYDGKSVTVSGKVSNFQTSNTMMGTVAGFQLCDTKCVVVIDQTNHARSNGSTATVTGTFHTSYKGPHKTFTNAIIISR